MADICRHLNMCWCLDWHWDVEWWPSVGSTEVACAAHLWKALWTATWGTSLCLEKDNRPGRRRHWAVAFPLVEEGSIWGSVWEHCKGSMQAADICRLQTFVGRVGVSREATAPKTWWSEQLQEEGPGKLCWAVLWELPWLEGTVERPIVLQTPLPHHIDNELVRTSEQVAQDNSGMFDSKVP